MKNNLAALVRDAIDALIPPLSENAQKRVRKDVLQESRVTIPPAMLVIAHRMGAVHHERLLVSPDELVLTRRGNFGTNTIRLQADGIEEVEIARDTKSKFGGATAGRVAIRSDRGSVELGAMRSEEELKWLRDVLVHVLTSASP